MDKETKNWLEMVEYDLVTAENMLAAGRYVYVVFMCHLAIEKALKALAVEATHKAPPMTHNLIYLVSLSAIKLDTELLDFIGIINNAGIVTRYPEDLSRLVASYPQGVASDYLKRTEEIVKCIKADPRLRK